MSSTKKAPMIALKSVKTLPATMLAVDRDEALAAGPSLRRRASASDLERPRSAVASVTAPLCRFASMASGELKLGLNLGYWGIGPAGEDALEVVQAAERAGF